LIRDVERQHGAGCGKLVLTLVASEARFDAVMLTSRGGVLHALMIP
jgi:hypothetical protein